MAFMRQSACLMINPITVDNVAALFNYTPVDRASDFDGTDLKLFVSVGWDRSFFRLLLVNRDSTDDLLLLQISSYVVRHTRDLHLSRNTLYLLSPRLCFFIVLKRELSVYRDDSFTRWRVIMRTEQPTKCFVPLQKQRVRLCTYN